MKDELDKLRELYKEAQRTLEELGIQLSVSKLQLSELKEKSDFNKTNSIDPGGNGSSINWTPDKMTSKCKGCEREFNLARRRHHCRSCGEIFCHSCSEQVASLPGKGQNGKPVRVCDGCWDAVADKNI